MNDDQEFLGVLFFVNWAIFHSVVLNSTDASQHFTFYFDSVLFLNDVLEVLFVNWFRIFLCSVQAEAVVVAHILLGSTRDSIVVLHHSHLVQQLPVRLDDWAHLLGGCLLVNYLASEHFTLCMQQSWSNFDLLLETGSWGVESWPIIVSNHRIWVKVVLLDWPVDVLLFERINISLGSRHYEFQIQSVVLVAQLNDGFDVLKTLASVLESEVVTERNHDVAFGLVS